MKPVWCYTDSRCDRWLGRLLKRLSDPLFLDAAFLEGGGKIRQGSSSHKLALSVSVSVNSAKELAAPARGSERQEGR